MSFDFSLSSNAITLNPGQSQSITLTQTSAAPQSVNYGLSSEAAGGWDSSTWLDELQSISGSFSPTPARLTGNGTLTLIFAATDVVKPQTLVVTVYGVQQLTGSLNSAITASQAITITIT